MTNTSDFQGKMRGRKYTLDTLSKDMGISRTALFNKIHNKQEFVASEIQNVKVLLDLTDEDVQGIFFAQSVEYNSTKGDA